MHQRLVYQGQRSRIQGGRCRSCDCSGCRIAGYGLWRQFGSMERITQRKFLQGPGCRYHLVKRHGVLKAIAALGVALVNALAFGATSSSSLYYYRIYVDRKSTRLNSSHVAISYAVFCLKKKKKPKINHNI